MGNVIKDSLYIIIFCTFWYLLIIIWYWLDAANGPNIFFQDEPNFEIFHNLRDEFLSISSDQNFIAAEVVILAILLFTGYKLFAFLVTVIQLLTICAFLFITLLWYFDSIDISIVGDYIGRAFSSIATAVFSQLSCIDLFSFVNRFNDLGHTSLLIVHAHVFVAYEAVINGISYYVQFIYDGVKSCGDVSPRLMFKSVLYFTSNYLRQLADAL